jgi:hypothetical protein
MPRVYLNVYGCRKQGSHLLALPPGQQPLQRGVNGHTSAEQRRGISRAAGSVLGGTAMDCSIVIMWGVPWHRKVTSIP